LELAAKFADRQATHSPRALMIVRLDGPPHLGQVASKPAGGAVFAVAVERRWSAKLFVMSFSLVGICLQGESYYD